MYIYIYIEKLGGLSCIFKEVFFCYNTPIAISTVCLQKDTSQTTLGTGTEVFLPLQMQSRISTCAISCMY